MRRITSVLVLATLCAARLAAQELTSPNFRMTSHTLDSGGSPVDAVNATHDSANFRILDALGPMATGDRAMASAGFQATHGFLGTIWGLGTANNEWMGTTDAGAETSDLWTNAFNWGYGTPTTASNVVVPNARATARVTLTADLGNARILANGRVQLEGGALFSIAPGGSLIVDPGGALRTGTTSALNRARIASSGAGSWGAILNGRLDVAFLTLEDLGALGLRVRPGATVPRFDGIRFVDGFAGGTYLNLSEADATTTLPATAAFCEFHPGPATNVTGDSTATFHGVITFDPWAGALGGPAFETNDPNDLVRWGSGSAPALVSPADGAFLATSVVVLDWNNADPSFSVIDYEVQVDDSPLFTLPLVFSATVVPSTATTPALPDGTYFWRVRWRNAGGFSPFSVVWSFVVDTTPPSVPILLSPPDGSTLGLPAVPLDWSDSTDATSGVQDYDVQVDTDPTYLVPIDFAATVVPSNVTTSALLDALYYWRVRARDRAGNVSAFTPSFTFSVLSRPSRWQAVVPGTDTGGGISNTSGPSTEPCLAMNPVTGFPGVAWTDADPVGGDREIYFRERQGSAFVELAGSASGGGLSANAGSSQSPSPAYNAAGRPLVAWQDQADGDPEIYVRLFDGTAWVQLAGSATGGGVSANGSASVDPSLAINPVSGQPGVAWTDTLAGDPQIHFREFDGTAWVERAGSASGRGLSNTTAEAVEPSIAYDTAGRVYVAWSDASNGNREIYLKRLEGGAWVALGGSASGGGVSNTPTPSRSPSLAMTDSGQPVVSWEEELPDGNSEIHARTFDGVGWREFGAGAATAGGVSDTPMDSWTPSLAGAGGRFFVSWGDASDPEGDAEIYGSYYENGAWREIGARSTFGGGISNNTGISTHPCSGIGGGYLYVCWQDLSSGNAEVYIRRLLLSMAADGPLEFIAAPGQGGGGRYRVFDDRLAAYAPLELRTFPFAAYNTANGTLHPAMGDLDGDALDEVVLGMGTYTSFGGWFVVLRDHSGRFDILRWRRLPWPAYNQANGAVFPACGDVDGDGRDEVVVGTGAYTPSGGLAALFDDLDRDVRFLRWFRSGAPSYSSMNGELHPACGDVDGDGRDEVVMGFGAGGGGRIVVHDDAGAGLTTVGILFHPNASYNSANGTIWPATASLTGGAGEEILAGTGRGGLGTVTIFADRAGGFKRIGALDVPWSSYNASVGDARPSAGNLDADVFGEVVVGLGRFPSNGGWLYVFDNVTTGSRGGRWVRYVNGAYNTTNGETWPAVGQLR